MTTEKEILIWVRVLSSLLEGKKKTEQEEIADRLLEILKRKKKEYLFPKIVKRLEKIYFQKRKVEFVLAREHSPETMGKIKKKILGILGEDKNIFVKIEKDLVGGFRVKTANYFIKASVKDFLDEFKNSLIQKN